MFLMKTGDNLYPNDNDRDWQRLDTAYVIPNGKAFFTPDGEGRIWYESLEELLEDTGLEKVVVIP